MKQDMTELTQEQMEKVKSLIQFAQAWCDQMVAILKNADLWQKGFRIDCSVDSTAECLVEDVRLHRSVIDGEGIYEEKINRYKGIDMPEFKNLSCCTTREFIHLFDSTPDGKGKAEAKDTKHPLPSDGLWIGDPLYTADVDGGQ